MVAMKMISRSKGEEMVVMLMMMKTINKGQRRLMMLAEEIWRGECDCGKKEKEGMKMTIICSEGKEEESSVSHRGRKMMAQMALRWVNL